MKDAFLLEKGKFVLAHVSSLLWRLERRAMMMMAADRKKHHQKTTTKKKKAARKEKSRYAWRLFSPHNLRVR